MQGIKFFEQSYTDLSLDNTITIDYNQANVDFMFDRDRLTRWNSIGADSDFTDVTLEIYFAGNYTFSDILLNGINLKEFDIDYYDGGWVSLVAETVNESDNYYLNFSEVTASRVRMIMKKTIVADAEKAVREFFILSSIGQLEYSPQIKVKINPNVKSKMMITGKKKFLMNRQSVTIDLDFKAYTSVLDRTLIQTLNDRFKPFMVWINAGDEEQFSYADQGYRMEDIYLMTIRGAHSHSYTKSIYQTGTSTKMMLEEVV